MYIVCKETDDAKWKTKFQDLLKIRLAEGKKRPATGFISGLFQAAPETRPTNPYKTAIEVDAWKNPKKLDSYFASWNARVTLTILKAHVVKDPGTRRVLKHRLD